MTVPTGNPLHSVSLVARLLEERLHVERVDRHPYGPRLPDPARAWAVAVELDPVPFGIGEVERLADAMIGGAVKKVRVSARRAKARESASRDGSSTAKWNKPVVPGARCALALDEARGGRSRRRRAERFRRLRHGRESRGTPCRTRARGRGPRRSGSPAPSWSWERALEPLTSQ